MTKGPAIYVATPETYTLENEGDRHGDGLLAMQCDADLQARRRLLVRRALAGIARAFPRAHVIVLWHTHRAGIWRVGATMIVKPGSVGQPHHAGYASFAMLEEGVVRLGEARFAVVAVLRDLKRLPQSAAAYA